MNIESKWLECWAPHLYSQDTAEWKSSSGVKCKQLVNISASKITPETIKNEYNVRLAANWVIPDHLCRTSFPFKRTLCHENEMKPIVGLHVGSLESRLTICQSQNVKVRWTVNAFFQWAQNASLEAMVVQIWESFAAPIRHDAKLPNSSRLCCRSSYK